MSEIALVTWDGGGNATVALEIGRALRAGGHHATILGPGSIRMRVECVGLSFREIGVAPPVDARDRLAYLLQVTEGTNTMIDDLHRLVEHSDAVVIDCNLSWALESRLDRPSAALVHTAIGLYVPVWQAVIDAANARRGGNGLRPLAAAMDAWAEPDLLLVAALSEFDRPLPPSDLRPVYVGPILSSQSTNGQSPVIRRDDPRPQVLISYSTDGLQNGPDRLQRALDALAYLPVSVLASTSGLFSPTRLRVPANAVVVEYLSYESVLASVDLAVCHAGHGTTMAALTHGIPLVCVPGLGRDQEPIAARVQELGLGIALGRDASSSDIGDAVAIILADKHYGERARDFARRTGAPDGARRAAVEIGRLLPAP
jgi:UDP:flavonoid glycosyltransferase YjiC (YdhE family)